MLYTFHDQKIGIAVWLFMNRELVETTNLMIAINTRIMVTCSVCLYLVLVGRVERNFTDFRVLLTEMGNGAHLQLKALEQSCL